MTESAARRPATHRPPLVRYRGGHANARDCHLALQSAGSQQTGGVPMTGIRNLDSWLRRMREDVAGLEIPQDLAERFGRHRDDPVGFARQVLGVDRIPDYQQAVMLDLVNNERVAWVAGHATGKSYAAALLLAWYMCTRPGSRCIVTSATFERQVGRVVFAKLRTLAAAAPEPLPLEVFATRAHVAGFPEWSAEGVPATKPGNFAGFHSDRMLVIADEAKALNRAVYEELHGVLASARNEARLLLLSTAGPSQGYFFDAFSRHQELWKLHRTPSTESPFATGYAERMREECLGEHDPIYRMRVLAEFAEDVEGQLIPISAIHAAVNLQFDVEDEEAATVLGCDVARYGDDRSVVCVRRGREVVELKSWRGADLMTTADRISSLINAHTATRTHRLLRHRRRSRRQAQAARPRKPRRRNQRSRACIEARDVRQPARRTRVACSSAVRGRSNLDPGRCESRIRTRCAQVRLRQPGKDQARVQRRGEGQAGEVSRPGRQPDVGIRQTAVTSASDVVVRRRAGGGAAGALACAAGGLVRPWHHSVRCV